MGSCKRELREVSDEELQVALKNPNNRAIIKKVGRYYRSVLSYDESYSCGLIALWKTLAKHDPNRGQKFTTSLYRFMKWECLRLISRSKANRWKLSQEITEDVLRKSNGVSNKSETLEYVREVMGYLREHDRNLINAYYVEGHTIEEIALSMEVAKESARQQLISAFDRLKELCCDVDLGCNRNDFLNIF